MPDFANSLNKFRESLPKDRTILQDYQYVQKAFEDNLDMLSGKGQKIRCLIIGEAPQSYEKYFYNPGNKKDTAFLRKRSLLNALDEPARTLNKTEMLYILASKGILIVDLYPLPLDSYYYKDISYYDSEELQNYWSDIVRKLNGLIAQDCMLAVRYNKLANTKNFNEFKDLLEEKLGIEKREPILLGSVNKRSGGAKSNPMEINEAEFKKLFL